MKGSGSAEGVFEKLTVEVEVEFEAGELERGVSVGLETENGRYLERELMSRLLSAFVIRESAGSWNPLPNVHILCFRFSERGCDMEYKRLDMSVGDDAPDRAPPLRALLI